MQVDEAGHHEHVAQIDHCSVRRQPDSGRLGKSGADLPDLAVGDDDGRVGERRLAGNGQQLPGMNDCLAPAGAAARAAMHPNSAAAAATKSCDLRIGHSLNRNGSRLK